MPSVKKNPPNEASSGNQTGHIQMDKNDG